jgi:8-oxo-dGTP pyrophosphatase MutT (NUDIX family)
MSQTVPDPTVQRSRPIPLNKRGLGRQFAALPVRIHKGRLEVMLVTSRDTGRWVLPKGWAEKRLSGRALAGKEAFEEAGILGEVSTYPVGTYRYGKRLPLSQILDCRVKVYRLEVNRVLEDWPERAQRQRQWFTLSEAMGLVDEAELAALLRSIPRRVPRSRRGQPVKHQPVKQR